MWSLGVSLFAMLSGFFPLDEATAADWRYPRLVEAQTRTRASTVKTVYKWYKRDTEHLTREVLHLLDALLAIDPAKRMTMEQLREHPWIHGSKFGDQGAFNASMEFSGEDGPTYRGFSSGPVTFEEDGMLMEEDEMPVYRSMGMPSGDSAGPPPALPGLMRQKACLNLLEPPSDPLAL